MDKAFFIDKDGTIVDHSGYPEIIPSDKLLKQDILIGLRLIQEKGYKIFIISNQPWVSKKRMTTEQIIGIFENIKRELYEEGISITDYSFCPHQTSDNCECKKPKPKMIFDLAKKHKINLSESFMLGDSDQDMGAGKNAGVKTALVLTGLGKNYNSSIKPDYVLRNVNDVGRIWLKN